MRLRVRYRDHIFEPLDVQGNRVVWDDHTLRIEGAGEPVVCRAALVQSVSLIDVGDDDAEVRAAQDRRRAARRGEQAGR